MQRNLLDLAPFSGHALAKSIWRSRDLRLAAAPDRRNRHRRSVNTLHRKPPHNRSRLPARRHLGPLPQLLHPTWHRSHRPCSCARVVAARAGSCHSARRAATTCHEPIPKVERRNSNRHLTYQQENSRRHLPSTPLSHRDDRGWTWTWKPTPASTPSKRWRSGRTAEPDSGIGGRGYGESHGHAYDAAGHSSFAEHLTAETKTGSTKN